VLTFVSGTPRLRRYHAQTRRSSCPRWRSEVGDGNQGRSKRAAPLSLRLRKLSSGAACAAVGVRSLGVDYGLRRVGLATSVGFAPTPLPALRHPNDPWAVAQDVQRIARDHVVDQLVVGLPLNAAGAEGQQVEATRRFLRALGRGLPILLWDERFSTAQARARLRDAGIRNPTQLRALQDSAAAVEILADFYAQKGHGALVFRERDPPPDDSVSAETRVVEEHLSFSEWKKRLQERVRERRLDDAKDKDAAA